MYEFASENPMFAIDRLVEHFIMPLAGAGVVLSDTVSGVFFEGGKPMLHSSFPYQLVITNRLVEIIPLPTLCRMVKYLDAC